MSKNLSPQPLRGKYLVKNPLANFFLRSCDFLLSCVFSKSDVSIPQAPKWILISNLAHMGDVLLMTSLLSVLKNRIPGVKIAVVVGSWSTPIVTNHPLVDKIHIVDHWKLNRSSESLLKKFIRYYRTKRSAIKEIRKEEYDIAIDSYSFFPNAIPIFWEAGIPVRIGYISGGFGPLLTHPIEWKQLNQHLIHYYRPFLEILQLDPKSHEPHLRPCLFLPNLDASALLAKHRLEKKEYIVIHMGTGNPQKEWPLSKWRSLVEKIQGNILVFTGKGVKERKDAEIVSSNVKGCINLINALGWDEYLVILKNAKCLIGVDSLAGHLASAMDLPSALIYSGMTPSNEWSPIGKYSTVLSYPMPCAPCYRSRGCALMNCVREVSVDDVLRAIKTFPSRPK